MMVHDRTILISSESSLEMQLIRHYAQELDRRIMTGFKIPYEFLYGEKPKMPYWAQDGCLIIPVLPPRSSMEIALLEAAEQYDPVKWIMNGSRIEWPMWKPYKLYPASRCVPKSTDLLKNIKW